MLYLEYERAKWNYNESQRMLQDILDRKEIAFQRTQPHSMRYDKDKVMGGKHRNSFDSYLIEMDMIEDDLKTAEAILSERLTLIKAKEDELRNSRNPEDVVYCLRYLDRLKIAEIAEKTW